MRGKDINLTVQAGSEAVRLVRILKENGEEWAAENIAARGKIWDMEMREELGEIECKVSGEGVIELTYPAMGLGRYIFAVDIQSDAGEWERLIEGYIGYEGPVMELEGEEYGEDMVIMLGGETRKVIFGKNTAWEGLYKETQAAVEGAREAEAGAELARDGALSALRSAQEFIDGFNEAVRRVIQIGGNGNWWIGGADTGVRVTGEDGKTPHIGNDGYWYVGETCLERKACGEDGLTPYIGANGHWCIGGIDTGVLARGRDGLDGTAVRRILVDSYEDIPWEGDTCNGGFYYYVYVPYVARAATGWIRLYNSPARDIGLYINGVHIVASTYGENPSVWVDLINAADCGVIATLGEEDDYLINLTAVVAGEAGSSITLAIDSDWEKSGDTLSYEAGQAATGWIEFGSPPYADMGLYINGVHIVANEAGAYLDTWASLINAADCGVTASVADSGYYINLTANEAGAAGNAITLRMEEDIGGQCGISGSTLIGGTDTDDVLQEEHYDVYAWLEPDGWVKVGLANDLATKEVHGLVKLGTNSVVGEGAVVGNNINNELSVPAAGKAVYGAVKLGKEGQSLNGVGVGVNADNELVVGLGSSLEYGVVKVSSSAVLSDGGLTALNANGQVLVNWASPSAGGAVKVGAMGVSKNPLPYSDSAGVTDGKQLVSNFTYGGAIQSRKATSWGGQMSWLDAVIETNPDYFADQYYTGLLTTEQFTQSEAKGLELLGATTSRLAGVYIATGVDDVRSDAVPNASTVEQALEAFGDTIAEAYRTKADSYSADEVDALVASAGGSTYTKAEIDSMFAGAHDDIYTKAESDARYIQDGTGNIKKMYTMYKSEFDQLVSREANAIYFVKKDV